MENACSPRPIVRSGALLLCVLLAVMSGCALPQEVTKSPRSVIEQLLLTQAVDRALEVLTVPLPDGEAVRLEVSGLQTDRAHLHLDEQDESFGIIDSPSWDLTFVRDAVGGRLGELGYRVRKREEDAAYLVRVMVQSMGTNQGKTFGASLEQVSLFSRFA